MDELSIAKDELVRVLRLRGDGAIALLSSLVGDLESIVSTLKSSLATLEELDREMKLTPEGHNPQQELIGVLRNNMPELHDKTDEEIIAMFNRAKK